MDLFSEIRGKPQPDFDSVFGSGSSPSVMGVQSGPPGTTPLMGGGGGLLTPEAVGAHASVKQMPGGQVVSGLTTDVESSLVRAAENLSEFRGEVTSLIKAHLWDSPLEKSFII